jgi:hypothetical protein
VADHVFRRHLRLEVSQIKGNQSSKQLADLEETRALLRNRIRQWRQVQLVYTPCVAPLVAESLAAPPIIESLATSPDVDDALPTEPAELIPLYLPSSLPEHLRQLPELASLLEKESPVQVTKSVMCPAVALKNTPISAAIAEFSNCCKHHNVQL